MLMVIFGAGASYDSSATDPADKKTHPDDRPPLAVHLFDNRPAFSKVLREFPDCQSIASDLRDRGPRLGVERVLEELQAESANDPIGKREMAAVRYYLQKIIRDCEQRWEERHSGATNYRTFMRRVRVHHKGPVSIVTFNYDTMLEKAMPSLGVEIQKISDYVGGNQYKVFKVHGSVNWMRVFTPSFDMSKVSSQDLHKWLIRHADLIFRDLDRMNDFEMVDDISEGKLLWKDPTRAPTEYALFPAIAIPVESKVSFEMPKEHLNQLKKVMPSITKLLVIGWRATDLPFLEILREAPIAQVDIVCENADKAREVRHQLLLGGINPNRTNTNYQGFTEFILSGKAQIFLSEPA
jgi:hypothetical protein